MAITNYSLVSGHSPASVSRKLTFQFSPQRYVSFKFSGSANIVIENITNIAIVKVVLLFM